MSRLQRRIFKLNDAIAAVAEQERLAIEELSFHRHLNDDASRDAAVSDHPLDRADARETAADVERFERVVAELSDRRRRLEEKRDRLLAKLG